MSLTASGLSHVYPQGTRVNERGHLEIGGCDAIELAREFGTPAYVVAEQDLRTRARSFLDAVAARHDDFDVLFASKAFPARPCTAPSPRRAWRATSPRAASCSSLCAEALTRRGSTCTATPSQSGSCTRRSMPGRTHRPRLARQSSTASSGSPPSTTPARRCWSGSRRASRATRTTRSRPARLTRSSGSPSTRRAEAIARLAAAPHLELVGPALPHRLPALRARAVPRGGQDDRDARRLSRLQPRRRPRGRLHGRPAAAVDRRVHRHDRDRAHEELGPGKRLLFEPGRALVANSTVTLYTVQSVKRNVSTWVAVDGGMSDNLRPMLYGAPYEALIASVRLRARHERCNLAGKHCESGDVIVRDVRWPTRPGRRGRDARPPAPTATRWPTTTTACRGRR